MPLKHCLVSLFLLCPLIKCLLKNDALYVLMALSGFLSESVSSFGLNSIEASVFYIKDLLDCCKSGKTNQDTFGEFYLVCVSFE